MRIIINYIVGFKFSLHIKSNYNIKLIKQLIKLYYEFDIDTFYLTYNEVIMSDDSIISNYNIPNNGIIDMHIKKID